MPDNTPQGIVTDGAAPAPASKEGDWEALAGNLLDGDPEGDTKVEEDADDGSGEAEEEPDEGDSDEEEDSKEEREDQPRDERGRFVSDQATVTLPDGSVVTVHELKRGFLREADYTQKTQKVSAQEREATERIQRAEQLETQLAQEREYAWQVLQSVQPPQPDASIIHSDPLGYMQQKAAWDDWQSRAYGLQQQAQEAMQRQQAQQQQFIEQRTQEERGKLLEAIPDFRDPAKFDAFSREALKVGKEVYGFSDAEMVITDHRLIRVLHDAVTLHRLRSQKTKAQDKAKGKPPVTPGRRQDPQANQTREYRRDRQTLTSTRGHGPEGDAAWVNSLDRLGYLK